VRVGAGAATLEPNLMRRRQFIRLGALPEKWLEAEEQENDPGVREWF